MDGARRVASNHLFLKVLMLGMAAVCFLGPVNLPTQWRWLDAPERAWALLLAGLLALIAGLLVRIAFYPGIFLSPEDFTVRRMFRSASMRWDEVARIRPIRSYGGQGEWLALCSGEWGMFSAKGCDTKQRVFLPGHTILIPSQFQAAGLRAFIEEMLLRASPEVLHEDEAVFQWMRDQVEGSGSLLTRLI